MTRVETIDYAQWSKELFAQGESPYSIEAYNLMDWWYTARNEEKEIAFTIRQRRSYEDYVLAERELKRHEIIVMLAEELAHSAIISNLSSVVTRFCKNYNLSIQERVLFVKAYKQSQ